MTAASINRPAVADALAVVYAAEADPHGAAQMIATMAEPELLAAVANLAALVVLARDVVPGKPLDVWAAHILAAVDGDDTPQ